jgi:hypothetical protein
MSILEVEGAACQRGSAMLAKKDVKDDVNHNCLCQSILANMARGQAPLIILGLGTAHRVNSLNKRRDSEPLRAAGPQPGAGVLTVIIDCKRNRDVLSQYL